MTSPRIDLDTTPDSPAGVLADLRTHRENARAAEVQMMVDAIAWAAMHSVDSISQAATLPSTEGAVAIAGEGAPLVAEFAIAELAAVLGRSTDSGRIWLGQVMECRYRLPRIWAALTGGRVQPWQARRIAEATLSLPVEAAAWVDRQLAPVAHKIGPAQLDRTITEALTRFQPDRAEAEAQAARESRYVTVETRHITTTGCVQLHGTLDLADALDLDDALHAVATTLAQLGSTDSLDVRRAKALGEIARNDHTLHLTTDSDEQTAKPGEAPVRVPVPRRQVVLYAHLTVHDDGDGQVVDPFVRVENTRSLITLDQLREWLTIQNTTVTVRPVLDLNEHLETTGYQPTNRLREQVALVNGRCVFPHCTRPARGCDTDHITAHTTGHAAGGPTCSCNLAPLCRRHHRIKTHTAWSYDLLDPGTYVWRSPHSLRFHVDTEGTTSIETTRHPSRP
ncbi:MAG TPA: HNH endonuclease signature motif containing protein [Nocardioides sp.]|uniref:HNH endonuclease signature motif containing protein n=1 Tax=Nocardioides sp. TaxID=35761 RepID=UPI002ED8EFD5